MQFAGFGLFQQSQQQVGIKGWRGSEIYGHLKRILWRRRGMTPALGHSLLRRDATETVQQGGHISPFPQIGFVFWVLNQEPACCSGKAYAGAFSHCAPDVVLLARSDA